MPTFCKCPYIPCERRGNCAACMAHSRHTRTLPNCMEEIAMGFGAVLPLRLPQTEVYPDESALAQGTAQLFRALLKENPHALLCLPAGQSAVETFRCLIEWSRAGKVDFSQARFVQLDEWLDLPDESQNCANFLQTNFYGPLGIDAGQITCFDIHAADLEAECRRMDFYLEQEGPIDLMLLGIGMNGHVGLVEPGVTWDAGAITVELSPTTQQVGQKYFSQAQPLSRGITLGMRHVFRAKQVVLQAAGGHKADIIHSVYTRQPHIDLPATVLKLVKGGVVLLDQAAAGRITELLPQGTVVATL